MTFLRYFLSISIIVFLNCCLVKNDPTTVYGAAGFYYDLENPTQKQFLPFELEEISGLTFLNSGELGCIQDEEGIFYSYNFELGEVTERFHFKGSGDFEGVEFIDGRFIGIESNGDLWFLDVLNESNEAKQIKTPLRSDNDVEGLGYWKDEKKLLLACKGDGSYKGNKEKGEAIYTFDLRKNEMDEKALFTIEEDEIDDFIESYLNEKKKGIRFNPSAIAFNEIEKRFYVLASSGNLLVVVNLQFEIENVVELNPSTYRQPEGICFDTEGDLFISSEGRGASGFILKFARQKI